MCGDKPKSVSPFSFGESVKNVAAPDELDLVFLAAASAFAPVATLSVRERRATELVTCRQ